MSSPVATPRPSLGRKILTVIYVLLALNSWVPAFGALMPPSSEPRSIAAMQFVVGTIAAAVAWGCWRIERWTSIAAVLYGAAMGAMIASLGPILDLPAEARGGLWVGAATLLLFGLVTAWLVRVRSVQRS